MISFGLEELTELVEDELHDLVLEDHVHGDVGLLLWSQQRWTEHDGHTLDRHAVQLTMFNHPVGRMGIGSELLFSKQGEDVISTSIDFLA